MNEHIPDIETYIKRLNWYLQEHYPANKKTTAEEWNALFLALINQGNAQEDTLAKICNEYLPLQIEKINTLVDTTNEHEVSIAQLRTDTNKALKDSNYAVITADTALNQVVEKMGTVAYINNVLAHSLHYTRDPQAQLDDTAQGIINLQNQIDLMEQNTNVADVVGTFVDLVNYDKSKITANDIVEVLQDETRANADTYYRLVENAWVYIGKLGSYYTRGESDALLAKKINYADYKDTLSFAESERQKSKNLFDYTKTYEYSASTPSNNGSYNIHIENSYYSEMKYKLKMKIGQPYSFSAYISYFMSTESSVYFSARVVYTDGTGDEKKTKAVAEQRVHFVLKPKKEVDYIIFRLLSTDVQATTNGQVYNIQIEEGSVATDYQPYNGQITHNGDPAVEFAEGEYQKSKNLFNENKYLISYCTYASNKWTTNSTRIGYNQSILTNETGATNNRNTSKLPLLKKGTYTLTIFNTVNNTNDPHMNIAFYNQDGTINGTYTNLIITTNTSITFTMASDLYLDIRVNGNTGTISFDHIQIEEGSTATTYQTYYGQITHNEDAPVVFAESEYQKSKNLFDAPNITMSSKVTYDSSTNTFTYTSGEVAEGATAFAQLNNVVMPAGNYVYSFNSTSTIPGDTTYIVAKLTSTGGFESGIKTIIAPAGKVIIPFTLTEDTYIGLCWYYKTGWSAGSAPAGSKTISKVQLEQGSTATDYQPYYGAIVHQGDIAPVVLYDKSSQNVFFGTAYPVGIPTQTEITSGVDFSPYKKLKVYYTHNEQYFGCADIDLTKQTFKTEGGNGTWCCLSDDGNAICAATFQVKTNSFKCTANGFTKLNPFAYNSRPTGTTSNTQYYIYRIEGIK